MLDQFAGGSLHNRGGFYHCLLGAGDVLLESFRAAPRFLLQREQPHIDAQEPLRDFVLKLLADLFAVIFLRRQNPVCEESQAFLELKRLIQALFVQDAPLLVGVLHFLDVLRARRQGGFQAHKIRLGASGCALDVGSFHAVPLKRG
jgi:hypothetical protein